MDDAQFDRLARACGALTTRRTALGGLVAAAAAAGRPGRESEVAAKRKRRKKRKKKRPPTPTCQPQCTGKVCGADGCDGECGQCTGGTVCDDAGRCVNCRGGGDCTSRICNDVTCDGGTCVYAPAADGLICGTPTDVCCAGTCADLRSDRSHCGACGEQCAGMDVCISGNCCTVCASGCAHTSIQAAVNAASPGAIVRICPGTYVGSVIIGKNLTLEGPVGGSAVIRNIASPVVSIAGGSTVVTLRRLTVTGVTSGVAAALSSVGTATLEAVQVTGNTPGTTPSNLGGGINNSGTLSLINSVVSQNVAFRGGGIINGGSVTLKSSVIEGNTASQGGGVYNGGPLTLTDNSRIRQNEATGGNGSGGGVFNVIGAVTLTGGSAISDNTPDQCVGC